MPLETLAETREGRAPLAPHPLLDHYYPTSAARPGFVRGLFDDTARHYDRINALISLGSGGWHRRQMLRWAGLRPGDQLLDVATGTGLLAREARRLLRGQGRVIGLDASAGMLAEAGRVGAADALVLGQAEALPFAAGRFDMVTLGYALRHLADLPTAFREFRRVLKPGGRLLLLELGQPEDRLGRALVRLYLGRAVPLLALLATGSEGSRTLMRYFWDTIESCVPPQAILDAMAGAGLIETRADAELGLVRSYVGTAP